MTAHLDNNFIGVEIEAERRDRALISNELGEYWRVEDDGSLRNGGIELVFRAPFKGSKARKALEISEKCLSKCSFSKRCGLHVHIDCRDLTTAQLKSFVLLYVLFEPVLLPYCGEGREASNFAVPLGKNKGLLYELSKRPVIQLCSENLGDQAGRYSALNFRSYASYGSLEFRSMRGTNDSKVITTWAEMLLCLKEVGKTRPKLRDMLKQSSEDTPLVLFESVFDDNAQTIFDHCGAEFHQRMVSGARNLQYVLQNSDKTLPDSLVKECGLLDTISEEAEQESVTPDDEFLVNPPTGPRTIREELDALRTHRRRQAMDAALQWRVQYHRQPHPLGGVFLDDVNTENDQ